MIPGGPHLVAFARKVLPRAPILLLHAEGLDHGFPEAREGEAQGAFAPWLTKHAPLLPTLARLHDALPEGAPLVMADLVWQTAPTPGLARAFAPEPGRDKVRPIEAYEMQAEHAGFVLVEKHEVPREAWRPMLSPAQQAELDADARGAARLMAWVFRRA